MSEQAKDSGLKRLTGLFKSKNKEGIYSGQVRETVTIPAGTYITVMKNGFRKSKNDPPLVCLASQGKGRDTFDQRQDFEEDDEVVF